MNAKHVRTRQLNGRTLSYIEGWHAIAEATHHRALHTVGDGEKWWMERGINPMMHAALLWRKRRGEAIRQPSRAPKLTS